MINSIHVLPVSKEDIPQAANTLYEAFQNDPLFEWLFVNKENYRRHGCLMFRSWIKYAVLYGKAWRTPQFESVLLRREPGDQLNSVWRKLRSGIILSNMKMDKQSLDRFKKKSDLSINEQAKNMGDQPFRYFWLLGTHPKYQGQGFGSALMSHASDMAAKDHLPYYLEATNEHAMSVYAHKGYKVLSQICLPDSDVKLTCMLREFVPSGVSSSKIQDHSEC